jgi:formylglycine-generating enzyme required for sulfatase activity
MPEDKQPTKQAGKAGWETTPDPFAATRRVPFMNCCGMLFVPIPRFKTLLSIIPVRVCDYESHCTKQKREYPKPDFPQDDEHPAVNVNWHEARSFCEWLTAREHARGILPHGLGYRLPTDAEWSAAAGLPNEPQITPRHRSGKIRAFPWGEEFPPPPEAGNYSRILGVDSFDDTSPVGSFAPNALGIYDLGGNVWEWCSDLYDTGSKERVARGASCFNDGEDYLNSSYRDPVDPDRRRNNGGFRLALSPGIFKDPQHRISADPWQQ